MTLRLQPVQIATGSNDSEGQLVFREGFLVAVLVHLSDDHEDDAGKWYLEVGFGQLATAHSPTFPDLDEAQDWIRQRLAGQPLSF